MVAVVDANMRVVRAGSGGEDSAAHDRHSRVVEIQRARLIRAVTGLVSELGVAETTVTHVVARAGVSRRTFYELFEDREDCLLAALEDAFGRVRTCVSLADQPGVGWARRVRTALVAILGFLDAEPAVARLLLLGSLAAGPRALERREGVLAELAGAVDRGRTLTGVQLPPLTAEGAVGGVVSILQARLVAAQTSQHAPANGAAAATGRLMALAGPLTGMIVRPYLGVAAARRESGRPLPAPARTINTAGLRGDPLRGLQMRLTYRTIRVLAAVAQHPGSSNRRIGEAAEIGDQGQVSKLLARLRRLGLIENTGPGARGEPNAWRLTTRGTEVNAVIAQLER